MSPAKILSAAALVALFAWPVGCWQLTGVDDFKVSNTPVCKPPPGSPCQVAPNCGCGDNETCELADAEGNGVCKPAGDVPRNGACATSTQCAKGMLCIDKICEPYCATDADCDTKQCDGISLGGTAVKSVGHCSTPCDPATPLCSDGRACRFLATDRAICLPPGSGADGATCTGDLECGPGLYCDKVCTALCVSGTTCANGKACVDVGAVYRGTTFGLCPR